MSRVSFAVVLAGAIFAASTFFLLKTGTPDDVGDGAAPDAAAVRDLPPRPDSPSSRDTSNPAPMAPEPPSALSTKSSRSGRAGTFVNELKTRSAAVEQELTKRGEHELRVRVVAAATQMINAIDAGNDAQARDAAREIAAVNALLASLKIREMAPPHRVDEKTGQVVW
jgi:hypothetical protein